MSEPDKKDQHLSDQDLEQAVGGMSSMNTQVIKKKIQLGAGPLKMEEEPTGPE